MLTLRYNLKSNAATLEYDEIGRKQLLNLLEELSSPGDHAHLMAGNDYPLSLDREEDNSQNVFSAIELQIGFVK